MILYPQVPEHWQRLTLGELCNRREARIEVGIRIHSGPGRTSDYGTPVVMPRNFRKGRIDHQSVERLIPPKSSVDKRYLIQRGDILCSRRCDIHRRALAGPEEEGWLTGNGCLRLRFERSKMDPRFACYYMSLPFVCSWLDRHALGAGIPHINRDVMMEMPFLVPPLSEQCALADLLEAIDEKLVLHEAMNGNLMETARLLYAEVTQGWIPGAAPKDGSRLGKIADCCERIDNGRTPARSKQGYWNGPIPWLTSGEIKDPVIVNTGESITREGMLEGNLKLWPKGTTVVAMFGSNAGQIALLDMDATANQACCGLIPKREFQHYLHLHLITHAKSLKALAGGAAQQNLNQRTIVQFPILIPEISVLQMFQKRVGPLFEKITANIRQHPTLTKLRNSLILKSIGNAAE